MPNSSKIKKADKSKPGFLTNLKNAANYVKDSTVVKIATGSGVGRVIGVVMVVTAATVATIPATVIGKAKDFSKETLQKQPETSSTVHHRKQKKLLQSHSIKLG